MSKGPSGIFGKSSKFQTHALRFLLLFVPPQLPSCQKPTRNKLKHAIQSCNLLGFPDCFDDEVHRIWRHLLDAFLNHLGNFAVKWALRPHTLSKSHIGPIQYRYQYYQYISQSEWLWFWSCQAGGLCITCIPAWINDSATSNPQTLPFGPTRFNQDAWFPCMFLGWKASPTKPKQVIMILS